LSYWFNVDKKHISGAAYSSDFNTFGIIGPYISIV